MTEGASGNAPFFVDNEVIVLGKNGIWVADGHEITHEPTRRLFARSLKHDDQGYFLHVGRETKRIQVEDTAYFVHRIDGDPKSGITVWVNDEKQETLVPLSLGYRPGRLVCRITRGGREEDARFLHSAYFDLLKFLQEDHDSYFLELGNQRVVLAHK